MAVYAVSDLHGQFGVFEKGLEKTGFSDSDELYVIGDAIDRGPDGIKILEYVKNHDNMDLIIGNHEYMMLGSVNSDGEPVADGKESSLWMYDNGGMATFEKYRELSGEDRIDLLDWLRTRYVIKTMRVNGSEICLTHSFYIERIKDKPLDELNDNDVWKTVWFSIFRDDFYTKGPDIYGEYNYTFITGHVPVQAVRYRDRSYGNVYDLRSVRHGNLINIDGGCAMGENDEIVNGAIFLRVDDLTETVVKL